MCNKYHSLYTHQSINVSIMSDFFSNFGYFFFWESNFGYLKKKLVWNIVIDKTGNGTIKVEHKIFILILSSSSSLNLSNTLKGEKKSYLEQNFYIKNK